MFRYSCTDNLPERFGKTFAQEWKKSTPVWLASLKNVVAWAPNEGAAWRLSPSLAVADPGEGPKGAPPIIFRLNWKKTFWRPPPPSALSQSPNDRTPPPPVISGSEFGTVSCGRKEGRFGFISGFMWMGPEWSNLHLNWFIRKCGTSSAITPWIVSRDHVNKRPYPDPEKVFPVLCRRRITHGWW